MTTRRRVRARTLVGWSCLVYVLITAPCSEEMMRQMGGLGPGAAGGAGSPGGSPGGDMGDLSKKVYQRPSLDDLDIEDEEEEGKYLQNFNKMQNILFIIINR